MAQPMKLLCVALIGFAALGILIWLGYHVDWTGFRSYTTPIVDKSRTFTRAKTLWDWLQLLVIPVALALGVFWLNHEEAKRKQATESLIARLKQESDEKRAATDRDLRETILGSRHLPTIWIRSPGYFLNVISANQTPGTRLEM